MLGVLLALLRRLIYKLLTHLNAQAMLPSLKNPLSGMKGGFYVLYPMWRQ